MEENSPLKPSAVHFSLGGPWMKGYDDCEFSDKWFAEKAHMDYQDGSTLKDMKCLHFHL